MAKSVMSDTTLSLAKITRPKLARVAMRERLFERLDEAAVHGVAWISGPAGAGKTTLVSSYLEHRGVEYLWYQLDQADTDAATLFHYLGRTAEKHRHLRGRPLPVFVPENVQSVGAFAKRFFRNLYQRVQCPFVLVFDNYHELPPQSGSQEAIMAGLDELPPGVCAMILSRAEPPSQMARYRAQTRLKIVDWSDLRFTGSEIADLAALRGVKLTDENCSRLCADSDGWAAGLVLMLESRRHGALSPEGCMPQVPQTVFDYLAGEIFDRFEPTTQEFLLRAAHLPRMTAPMAEAVSGQADAARLLMNLTQNNYFVTEKQNGREREYQMHILFREFLLKRARDTRNVRELAGEQRTAAEVLLAAGRIEDAVALFAEIAAWDRVASVVRSFSESMLDSGRDEVLGRWLDDLPPEAIAGDPWLQYWSGAASARSAPRAGRRWFEKAYASFVAPNIADPRGAILSCVGVMNTLLAELDDLTPLDRWIAELDRLLKAYPDILSTEEARICYCMFMAQVLRQPSNPDLDLWLVRASQLARGASDATRQRGLIEPMVAIGLMLTGELDRARNIIDALREAVARPGLSPVALVVFRAAEAMCHALSGRCEACLASVRDGLGQCQTHGIKAWRTQLLASGMSAALAEGDLAEAAQLCEQWHETVSRGRRIDQCFYHYLCAWTAALRRDVITAYRELKEALEVAIELGIPFLEVLCRSAMVQVLFECGDRRQGTAQGRRLHGLTRDLGNPLFEFMTLLSYAAVAIEEGRRRSGLNSLRYAFGLGREHGFLPVLWWQPAVMARLCLEALEENIDPDYARHLIRTRKLFPESPPLRVAGWPWPFRISALGDFRFMVGEEVQAPPARTQGRPLELLKVLIALGGRNVRADLLAETLWPRVDEEYARKSFTITLHRLRKMFGAEDAVLLAEGRVSLNQRQCHVDTWQFEQIANEIQALVRRPLQTADPNLMEALTNELFDCYTGPFLKDESDFPCYVTCRDTFRGRLLQCLTELVSFSDRAGHSEAIVDCYERAIACDREAEGPYRALMLAYRKLGRQADALNVYERCRNECSLRHGALSPQIQAIYEALVRDSPTA